MKILRHKSFMDEGKFEMRFKREIQLWGTDRGRQTDRLSQRQERLGSTLQGQEKPSAGRLG